MVTYAIETEDLCKDYSDRKVVCGLNLRVQEGELFGFLGPNGAGKTTTIRMLTTLTKPTSGRILINGIDLLEESSRVKAEFGIVQQHISLNRDQTVRENLELHARLHHLSPMDREDRIEELLKYVNLEENADQLVDHLSGGMKRRTMIARALIHRPKLLILDEPTVGLDAQARRRVWDLLRKMNSDGSTLFFTTHYIEEAESLCDRVGIMHQGRLVALGTPEALRMRFGLVTVEVKDRKNGTKYRYFSDRVSATEYVKGLSTVEKMIMRESNLEDVFVGITGKKVLDE